MPKVNVVVTVKVPIDLDAWNLSYGQDEDVTAVAATVQSEAAEILAEHYRRTGVLAG